MVQLRLRWYRLFILLLSSFMLYILLHSGWVALPIVGRAESISPTQLVERGITQYQAGDFPGAIATWQQALQQAQATGDQAAIRNNLAQAYQQVGQTGQAIVQREQAIQVYQASSDEASRRLLAQLLIEQAQAYGNLGQYRRTLPLVGCALKVAGSQANQSIAAVVSAIDQCSLKQLTSQPDQRTEIAALGALGDAYTALGDYSNAESVYQGSLDRAAVRESSGSSGSSDNTDLLVTVHNNLGNFYLKQAERYRFQSRAVELEGDLQQASYLKEQAVQAFTNAHQAYQQSWQTSQAIGGIAEATALLNLTRLLAQSELPDRTEIANYQDRIEQLLNATPDSRAKVYGLINLARSLPAEAEDSSSQDRSIALLQQALASAQKIGDRRSEAYALGSLGELEENAAHYELAMQWTEQAGQAAQEVGAAESLYRWQWQRGRIFKKIGEPERAIQAYQQAIVTLQSIRGDIASASAELQFNFRDAVEPVYREYMALLLELPEAANTTVLAQDQPLPRVLNTLELLKLAELQNFFGDECVQLVRDRVEQDGRLTDAGAAVLYSVILEQRTEMILQTPDGKLSHYPIRQADGTLISAEEMREQIDRLRRLLEKRTTDEYVAQAQAVYDLLIRPLAADLAAARPRTLVLINDDVLRNVPLAALHDGQQFLAEQYAIATTPGLSLTTGTPMDRKRVQALVLGLTVAKDAFPALTNVEDEVTEVQSILGGTKLLNQDFTLDKFKQQLQAKRYPIIHIATHGRFGVDAANTFLQAYDQRLQITAIDELLRPYAQSQPVELLTLSSCETAAGDNRTALGIAGVAVRAGAKGVVATLWFINDAMTVPLIEQFYQSLRQPELTKAEALQKAQMAMIHNPEHPEYSHPAVWAPFVLVGNWL